MKLRFVLLLNIIMMLIFIPNYANYLNGRVDAVDGVYVYTDSEWDSEILGMNKLRSLNNNSPKVLNGESIKYDFSSANSEGKIKMLFGQMLQKAQHTVSYMMEMSYILKEQ